jgi:hypothetical protein
MVIFLLILSNFKDATDIYDCHIKTFISFFSMQI